MFALIKEKIIESLKSVCPIALIILAVSVIFTPLDGGTALLFILGVALLVVGMGLFNIGADVAMLQIGGKIGARITSSKKLWLIALISFVIGMIITLAEPDLQILATLVSDEIAPTVLMVAVSLGVGIFLVIALLRILFRVPLRVLLICSYAVVFILCAFVPSGFLSVAFDSGGVTTGPMTVPFIMSLGMGVASVRGGKEAGDDSFGLIALSSVGPVIAVELLGIIFNVNGGEYIVPPVAEIATSRDAFMTVCVGLGEYALEVLIALSPIIVFFVLSQLTMRIFSSKGVLRVIMGFIFTFVGLSVFLTGANVGFMPVGLQIGSALASDYPAFLTPIAMVIGFFVTNAEPAVYVLVGEVRRSSSGAITERSMRLSLCVGVSVALGLAMVRVFTGVSVLWVLVPGYAVSLILTFFTPKMYTGIAFDSGGVASGAMVSAFVLPMAMGATTALGGNVFTDAFGCVSFVALTPLITIQILGLIHRRKTERAVRNLTTKEDGIKEYEVDYVTEIN